MKLWTAIFIAGITSAVFGCATPTVVDEQKVGDEALTCQQIEEEIRLAKQFEDEAREERGVTGTNVAAALFFWPALLVTAANVDEAVDAAEERQNYLREIHRSKNC
jgi:hypothetical protein